MKNDGTLWRYLLNGPHDPWSDHLFIFSPFSPHPKCGIRDNNEKT
jgi:hypothetical protein